MDKPECHEVNNKIPFELSCTDIVLVILLTNKNVVGMYHMFIAPAT